MKFLNIITLIFCIYAFTSKGIEGFFHFAQQSIRISDPKLAQIFSHTESYEFTFLLFWTIVFFILIVVWIFAQYKKKQKLKLILAACTLILSLLMSITDNIEYSVYLSDIVVGGEMLQ
ncbi:MAG: hypothetical protein ACK5B9_15055 [Flavobacteriia bacterium]|jgi:asparagine N-glycosylation enzyme membrane subunit Stt3